MLVQRARAGDVEAFACLAAEQQPALARFCRRLMGDTAAGDDLAQETVLRAQQSIGRLGEPYRFGPWLLGIAANLAKKAWRAERRRPYSLEHLIAAYPNVPWDESHTVVPSPEQISEDAEESRLLLEAIKALPAALSRAVVLHYLKGLNYAEVAEAMAVPVSTVKGRLFESRVRLRRKLARDTAGTPRRASAKDLPAQGSHTHDVRKGTAVTMIEQAPRHIRIEVDLEPVIDEAYRFVTTKWPRPNPVEALGELGLPRNHFVPIQCLEQMVLAGVTRREDIADFVASCFAGWDIDVR